MEYISRLRKTSLALVTTGFIALSVTVPLNAQEGGSQGLTEQNCIVIKTSVQQVQRSDLEARIIRGRAYDNILSLMTSLNSRLALNNMGDTRMVEIANELNTAFPEFIHDYSVYETSLETLQKTNCKNETAKFNDRLNDVRQKRTLLKEDVELMRGLINEYQAKVKAIKQDLIQEAASDED